MFTTGVFAVLEDDTVVALFFTGRHHAGENLDELQELRDPGKRIPIQMCDALSRNTNELFQQICRSLFKSWTSKFCRYHSGIPG